ncbi:ComEC/Rec2 family competence protein [Bifidobacterium saguinibicoloris]|uniref:ComEC/Rec2 family competence protein n=1 Tax=Bifidobacterium saguinibicoloris TaxID=2834433 RepID=UPI001C56E9C0|nr:ComEC/Rec2 family competence protein [Bifidobacterium saguinibicoloris]MBW3080097.1 ComEC/Rec2 family competence protein [Bifidobacterium saguinibicoloris]
MTRIVTDIGRQGRSGRSRRSGRAARRERIERGGDDRRLLPVALALWGSCLGTHLLFDAGMAMMDGGAGRDDGSTGVTNSWALSVALLTIIAVAALWQVGRVCARNGTGRVLIIVCVAAALLGANAAWCADVTAWSDPAAAAARDGAAYATVEGTALGGAQASSNRNADCQTDLRLRTFSDGSVIQPSTATVRLFASGHACTHLRRGAAYQVQGTLSQAEIGAARLWLVTEDGNVPQRIRDQPKYEQWRERVQTAFLDATEGLSEQGRILVPGLTMGLLGQDRLADTSPGITPIDDTYAQRLEDRFRTAGIMHLMAVSGGHFAVIAELIRRIGAWLLADRRVIALATMGATALLAALMASGDSVDRALVMGWVSAAAMFLGRQPQALSALNVTAIGMLLTKPALAYSYGFALSCAAVLGIILMARGIAGVLARLLPDALADMTAMTVAAQLATLPIQVLMEPSLPVWSVPANLLTAPVVTFATLAGLAGLAVAWASPSAGAACAWVASWGTQVMERVAMWLGSGEHAVIPWAGGVGGAMLLLAVEGCLVAAVLTVRRRFGLGRDMAHGMHALPGERFGRNPRNRIRIWWADTVGMMERWNRE